MVMKKLGALIVAIAIMAPAPVMAYTQEEANACTPDAFKLCQDAIPDVSRVAHCLAQKKKQLSSPCLAVFDRSSSTVAERARAHNIQETKY
jgi:hypothetical protein